MNVFVLTHITKILLCNLFYLIFIFILSWITNVGTHAIQQLSTSGMLNTNIPSKMGPSLPEGCKSRHFALSAASVLQGKPAKQGHILCLLHTWTRERGTHF